MISPILHTPILLLSRWWAFTPYREGLQTCLGAFGLHLSSRLEHFLGRGRGGGGGGGGRGTISQNTKGSPPQTGEGCEWLGQVEHKFELPQFPNLDRYELHQWTIPIPRLLPDVHFTRGQLLSLTPLTPRTPDVSVPSPPVDSPVAALTKADGSAFGLMPPRLSVGTAPMGTPPVSASSRVSVVSAAAGATSAAALVLIITAAIRGRKKGLTKGGLTKGRDRTDGTSTRGRVALR